MKKLIKPVIVLITLSLLLLLWGLVGNAIFIVLLIFTGMASLALWIEFA